jgi:hypothetical protein
MIAIRSAAYAFMTEANVSPIPNVAASRAFLKLIPSSLIINH